MKRDKPLSKKDGAARQPSLRRLERMAERRRQYITAARATFHEKGFAAASIGDIIARTGGSRGTLYIHFGSKLALFEAVVRDDAERFARAVAEIIAIDSGGDLDLIVERLIAIATSKETIGLLRTVIAERLHYPGIGEIYRQIVPDIQIWIRRLFQEEVFPSAGQSDEEAGFLADMFLAIVLADTQMAILTGLARDDDKGRLLSRTRQHLHALLPLQGRIGKTHPSENAPQAERSFRDEH